VGDLAVGAAYTVLMVVKARASKEKSWRTMMSRDEGFDWFDGEDVLKVEELFGFLVLIHRSSGCFYSFWTSSWMYTQTTLKRVYAMLHCP
jgi:hypothetical protein